MAEDPALQEHNITFICHAGQVLNGSNSSTCMGNGEWEPDPREVECTGVHVPMTTGSTILGTYTMHNTTQGFI